jgi:hypothetical protein
VPAVAFSHRSSHPRTPTFHAGLHEGTLQQQTATTTVTTAPRVCTSLHGSAMRAHNTLTHRYTHPVCCTSIRCSSRQLSKAGASVHRGHGACNQRRLPHLAFSMSAAAHTHTHTQTAPQHSPTHSTAQLRERKVAGRWGDLSTQTERKTASCCCRLHSEQLPQPTPGRPTAPSLQCWCTLQDTGQHAHACGHCSLYRN